MRQRNWLSIVVATTGAIAAASNASGQAEPRRRYFAESIQTPPGTIELALESHYSQGVGLSARGVRATDLSHEGVGFGFTTGYLVSPAVLLGFGARYDEFAAGEQLVGRGTSRGLVAGPVVAYHFAPAGRLDPWVLGGIGYRMLWLIGDMPGHDELWHGFELARGVMGVDLHVSDHVAIGPMFGGDISMFAWRHVEGVGSQVVDGKRVEVFLEAGLQARFDFGRVRR